MTFNGPFYKSNTCHGWGKVSKSSVITGVKESDQSQKKDLPGHSSVLDSELH